jgi:hypothetical protein
LTANTNFLSKLNYLKEFLPLRIVSAVTASFLSFDIYYAITEGVVIKNGTEYVLGTNVYFLKVATLGLMTAISVAGVFYPFDNKNN